MKNKPNYRIKKTNWDNWYGYEGHKKVKAFTETAEFSQEQNARRWLAEMHGDVPGSFECAICGASTAWLTLIDNGIRMPGEGVCQFCRTK